MNIHQHNRKQQAPVEKGSVQYVCVCMREREIERVLELKRAPLIFGGAIFVRIFPSSPSIITSFSFILPESPLSTAYSTRHGGDEGRKDLYKQGGKDEAKGKRLPNGVSRCTYVCVCTTVRVVVELLPFFFFSA